MFWKLTWEEQVHEADLMPAASDGRFVLHRHRDHAGPHLDLRLEQGEWLVGWRIDATSLDNEPWATEKAPHPLSWLEQDGDAAREDAGRYAWLEYGPSRRRVRLEGRNQMRVLRAEREDGLAPAVVRAICAVLAETDVSPENAPRMMADGATARQRATERFCGLGRELDGVAFDDVLWRKALSRLTLDEIHTFLRAYEVRFDQKYPPRPVSEPETLPEGSREDRTEAALTILRE